MVAHSPAEVGCQDDLSCRNSLHWAQSCGICLLMVGGRLIVCWVQLSEHGSLPLRLCLFILNTNSNVRVKCLLVLNLHMATPESIHFLEFIENFEWLIWQRDVLTVASKWISLREQLFLLLKVRRMAKKTGAESKKIAYIPLGSLI